MFRSNHMAYPAASNRKRPKYVRLLATLPRIAAPALRDEYAETPHLYTDSDASIGTSNLPIPDDVLGDGNDGDQQREDNPGGSRPSQRRRNYERWGGVNTAIGAHSRIRASKASKLSRANFASCASEY